MRPSTLNWNPAIGAKIRRRYERGGRNSLATCFERALISVALKVKSFRSNGRSHFSHPIVFGEHASGKNIPK
jgi:hypothetical protein